MGPVRACQDGPAEATIILSEPVTPEQIADRGRRDRAMLVGGPAIPLRFYLDRYWADERNVYMLGFMFVPGEPIGAMFYLFDGERVPVPRTERVDAEATYAEPVTGFAVLMPFRAGEPILLEVE